jgi:hypothetical protein
MSSHHHKSQSLRQHVQAILDDLESTSEGHDPQLVVNAAFALMVLKWREQDRGEPELKDWLRDHLAQLSQVSPWPVSADA